MGDDLVEKTAALRYGDVTDLSNFGGAVIDRAAFDRNRAALKRAKTTAGLAIPVGGGTDDREGYFVDPTVILGIDPGDEIFRTEYFGPILAVHVYDDSRADAFTDILRTVDTGSAYALTGSVIADDREAVAQATRALRFTAGNFYVNDKPTGAMVGQQPFGGARASGTNDKAGSPLNLLRWASMRTIKETFTPPTDHRYPHQG